MSNTATVRSLRNLFVNLRSDYTLIMICFGHIQSRVVNIKEPNWNEFDERAYTLIDEFQNSLKNTGREITNYGQKSRWRELKEDAASIKHYLRRARSYLEGLGEWEYPAHVTFSVIGAGNENYKLSESPPRLLGFQTGRMKVSTRSDPASTNGETAIKNALMSGALQGNQRYPVFYDNLVEDTIPTLAQLRSSLVTSALVTPSRHHQAAVSSPLTGLVAPAKNNAPFSKKRGVRFADMQESTRGKVTSHPPPRTPSANTAKSPLAATPVSVKSPAETVRLLGKIVIPAEKVLASKRRTREKPPNQKVDKSDSEEPPYKRVRRHR
jgi:hypothetical protein